MLVIAVLTYILPKAEDLPVLCELISNHLNSICQSFADPLPKLCRPFAKALQNLCQSFADPLPKLCRLFAKPLQSSCQTFAEYLPNLCRIYSINPLPNVCKPFACDVPKKYLLHRCIKYSWNIFCNVAAKGLQRVWQRVGTHSAKGWHMFRKASVFAWKYPTA